MKYYIAYGSNLNMSQMALRCPDATPVTSALLTDMTMVFRGNARGCGVATVERKVGSDVPVGIWKISAEDEKSLDRYEGYPYLYLKKYVKVHVDGKEVSALIYIMTPGRTKVAPSSSYYETIKQGYRDFGFDVHQLARFAEKGGAK